MTLLLRFCSLLLGSALLASPAAGQHLQTAPLSADPGRAARYQAEAAAAPLQLRSTTVVALPFFDDFTSPLEGRPKLSHWLPAGGALVSNRFAVEPPTRGAANLDGLRANGKNYCNCETTGDTRIDTLTSQTIDLSGMTASDLVGLSFAWQAGSIIGPPELNTSTRNVSLELEFKSNVAPNRWESVWVYRSTGVLTPFRQQVVLINQARFLHSGFQFRFRARGNSSQASDVWSIDYVLLDRNRGVQQGVAPLADTVFIDVATSAGFKNSLRSGGLRSPLRRYTAMPVWQYNAAATPGSELNPVVGVNIMNLIGAILPRPITVLGTVRELPSGAEQAWLSRGKLARPRLDSVAGDARRQPIATTATPKRLRYTLALTTGEPTPRTLANDTIFRDVDLNNYYAYDDGTAEYTMYDRNTTSLPTYWAYRFELNQPDQVRALRVYPIFTPADQGNNRTITINVWSDVNGRPSNLPIATRLVTITNPLPVGWEYVEIAFAQPVDVTGTFYVGMGQNGSNTLTFRQYGFDLNSSLPPDAFWSRNIGGIWTPETFSPQGALMMRPVMNNRIPTASTAPTLNNGSFTLYPNPAHGTVQVSGPAFVQASVLDALGRRVWEQPRAEAGQPRLTLGALPPGVYLVRLALPDGSTATRRLLLE
jgi:hypothetical protein